MEDHCANTFALLYCQFWYGRFEQWEVQVEFNRGFSLDSQTVEVEAVLRDCQIFSPNVQARRCVESVGKFHVHQDVGVVLGPTEYWRDSGKF